MAVENYLCTALDKTEKIKLKTNYKNKLKTSSVTIETRALLVNDVVYDIKCQMRLVIM